MFDVGERVLLTVPWSLTPAEATVLEVYEDGVYLEYEAVGGEPAGRVTWFGDPESSGHCLRL